MYYKIINFCLLQCLIGDGDIIMNYIMKVSAMINQIQQVVKNTTPTKITIENFQKQQYKIFKFDSTITQLDNTVKNSPFLFLAVMKYLYKANDS